MPLSRQRRGRSGRRVARTVEPARPTRRRPTNKFYLLASVVIAVLVIASFAFASFSGGQGGGSGPASAYVDGVGVEQEIMASKLHIPDGEFAEYNTVPATSGDHWVLPQACGFYEEALPDERTTHNLEHGNIVVSYNLLSSEEVEELKGVMDDIGLARLWGVTRAYPKIEPGQVALAAWGVSDVMDGIDKDRIEKFFETYGGALGPEAGLACSGTTAPHSR